MSELLWAGSAEVWKTSLRGSARLEWFYDSMIRLLATEMPLLVVVEGYAYARGNQQAAMGELGGVVRLALHKWGGDVVVVPPSSLKKFVTGKGNAPKDKVMMEAYKRFEIDVPTTDECEALCLALMGATGSFDYVPNLPVAHLEALKKIKWMRHGAGNFWAA